MKPFNLEEAKAGKPVVTRSGRPVRIGLFDRKHLSFPIVGVVLHQDGVENPFQWTITGAWYDKESPSTFDLFMATEKKTGWIIIQPKNRVVGGTGSIYCVEATAKERCCFGEIPVKIEWEE